MVVIEHAMNLVEVNVSDVDRIRPSHIIRVVSQVSRWNEMWEMHDHTRIEPVWDIGSDCNYTSTLGSGK